MKVYAVGVVKDERDILPFTLDHWLAQDIDGILLADNMSDDGTRDIIQDYARQYPKLITPLDDLELRWFQSAKMTSLANLAHDRGADWIVPFDADEWYVCTDGQPLGAKLRDCPHPVVGASIWHYFATDLDVVDDPNPYSRMAWRGRDPSNLVKVAFQWRAGCVLSAGNHALHMQSEEGPRYRDHDYGIQMKHFPYRSAEQFLHGIENGGRALKATGFPLNYGGHWRLYHDMLEASGPDAVKAWWREHFYFTDPSAAGLVHEPITEHAYA